MEALLIIDMQRGMLDVDSLYEIDAVVARINGLARLMRNGGKPVVFVQHAGPPGDPFARGTEGWKLLAELERSPEDVVVEKTICDSFYNTDLDSILKERCVKELLICGWATDFCVDTTIRAAASHDYAITVVADAHTVADRPHLDACSVIGHHHKVWQELIVPQRPIRVLSTDEISHVIGASSPTTS